LLYIAFGLADKIQPPSFLPHIVHPTQRRLLMHQVPQSNSEFRHVSPSLEAGSRRSRPQQHGFLRRILRGLIHFFSYHLILNRKSTRYTRAAGFRLAVRPTVFHPRYFISSECFAAFIDGLDLRGKRVADVGTGTGILALAAARAGAKTAFATDINPNAALSAVENARANDLGHRVTGVCTNLLAAFAPGPLFDVILSSPPKHAAEPRDMSDRGWHAGPQFRDVAALFEQARERLAPNGRCYVMLSSDSDLNLFGMLMERAGFRSRLVHEHSILIESFVLYELQAA
jgi:release factor glutamine methyltransferase